MNLAENNLWIATKQNFRLLNLIVSALRVETDLEKIEMKGEAADTGLKLLHRINPKQ